MCAISGHFQANKGSEEQQSASDDFINLHPLNLHAGNFNNSANASNSTRNSARKTQQKCIENG